jgi:hypothetical protein
MAPSATPPTIIAAIAIANRGDGDVKCPSAGTTFLR